MKNFKNTKENGFIIVQVMVFGAVAIMIIGALASATALELKAGKSAFAKEQAFQTAEAGIEYYRWHLAHAPSDYQDGTNGVGPYVHSLKDKNGDTVGQFSLTVTAPVSGSTLVKIKSSGLASGYSSYPRIISSQVSKPSIAEHAFAGNDAMRFGQGTEVFGSVYVNGGIRFDGLAHNVVSSGATIYDDPDHSGSAEIGVHTHVAKPPASGILSSSGETNPNAIPIRTDVFEAGRRIGQPTIDFSGFTTDIANLKSLAQGGGFYRDAAGAGYVGYHLVLKTNDTFDLYKINTWASLGNNCTTTSTGSWSVGTQTLQGNYSFPTNGVLFFQDHIVVDGQINGARITIAAALLPEPTNTTLYKNIIINNDLAYTNYDGTDSIGLAAQGGVMVGLFSDDNLRIDGALMAQHNIVGRFSYADATNKNCVEKTRSSLTLYGMIASYGRYGFAYTNGTGYTNRYINYDANLLYAPPPSFPLTSNQYQILSWQEVKS